MLGGYMGKVLYVDLTSGKIEEKPLNEEYAKKYIGGYGLGARYLLDLMEPNVDPLGPDNVIGITTGPLTGAGPFFGGRYIINCKSPVTQTWNDASCGGFFGPELKKSGYDAVFISGKSEKPVYLYISDEEVEIRDAAKYWGMDTNETLDSLVEDTGQKKLRVAVIGPPGENLSLLSCTIDDYHRAAARGGVGAVFGSKNLKGVAAVGKLKIPVVDKDKVKELNKQINTSIKDPANKQAGPKGAFGTGAATGFAVMLGDTPVNNWKGVAFLELGADMHKLSASAYPQYSNGKYNCAFCPLGCGQHLKVEDGEWPLPDTERPEYESAAAFGSLCGSTNFESTIKCNDICSRYGLDTISTGATVAWAIECFENGLITTKDTEGIELKWNDPESVVKLTEAIAKNEGFGKILKLGSKYASEALGGLGAEYLVTASGIEPAMHDPRCAVGCARTYQYDPTPGRHTKGGVGLKQIGTSNPIKYDPEYTGAMDYPATVNMEVTEIAGLCQFIADAHIDNIAADLVAAVTGLTREEVLPAGERALQIRNLFNIREGLRRKDFTLSDRAVGVPPQQAGPTAGKTVDNEKLGDIFFTHAAWDLETMIPSYSRLDSLGMADVAESVEAVAATK